MDFVNERLKVRARLDDIEKNTMLHVEHSGSSAVFKQKVILSIKDYHFLLERAKESITKE